MRLLSNYPLQNLNSFGIDVKAESFMAVHSYDDLLLLKNHRALGKNKILILGGGSNILFKDDFKGLILKSEIKGISEIEADNNNVVIEAGSGVDWDELVEYTVLKNYYGIENLSLIPGSVGAAPIQNIGAYGTRLEEVFLELEGVDLNSFEKKVFNKKECEFGYRDSVFMRELKNEFFITKIRISLKKGKNLKLSYRAIKDFLRENNIEENSVDLKKVREIIIAVRRSKLPDPAKIGNAGSFFKNPIINNEAFAFLKDKYKDLVFFKVGKDEYKIPAAWLIEKTGFRGKRFGNFGVHDKQALVLVNYGNAKGKDLVKLSENIRDAVYKNFRIKLDCEVNIV